MPDHKYRVMVSGVKEYDGDNLADAARTFARFVNNRHTFQQGEHTITAEPLVEAISPGGRSLAVFYGATLENWNRAVVDNGIIIT